MTWLLSHQDDLCQFVFEDLDVHHQDPAWLCSRAIICPTNTGVDRVNDMMMSVFPGVAREYLSSDSVEENEHQFPLEFINQLTPSGLPPHRLVLKKNWSIMLLQNIDPVNGHCNGTRYTLQQLNAHVLDAVVATGPHAGKRIFIPLIPMAPSGNTFPFQMIRRQFPVRPAFAITSNKGQGQTLQRVGLYLEKPFFSHGQYYVVNSRVGSSQDLKVVAVSSEYTGYNGIYTDNVVYHEVL